jgi:hypothetical protein
MPTVSSRPRTNSCHDASAPRLKLEPGALDLLRGRADAEIDARPIVGRLQHQRAGHVDGLAHADLLRARSGNPELRDECLRRDLVHRQAGRARTAADIRAAIELEKVLQGAALSPRTVKDGEHDVRAHGAELVEPDAVDGEVGDAEPGALERPGHHGPGAQAHLALGVGASLEDDHVHRSGVE